MAERKKGEAEDFWLLLNNLDEVLEWEKQEAYEVVLDYWLIDNFVNDFMHMEHFVGAGIVRYIAQRSVAVYECEERITGWNRFFAKSLQNETK